MSLRHLRAWAYLLQAMKPRAASAIGGKNVHGQWPAKASRMNSFEWTWPSSWTATAVAHRKILKDGQWPWLCGLYYLTAPMHANNWTETDSFRSTKTEGNMDMLDWKDSGKKIGKLREPYFAKSRIRAYRRGYCNNVWASKAYNGN